MAKRPCVTADNLSHAAGEVWYVSNANLCTDDPFFPVVVAGTQQVSDLGYPVQHVITVPAYQRTYPMRTTAFQRLGISGSPGDLYRIFDRANTDDDWELNYSPNDFPGPSAWNAL